MTTKQNQIATLDGLRRSMIMHAVTRGIAGDQKLKHVGTDWLDQVPLHWDVCRVKRVLARMDYGISESTVEEGRYPVLKMGHIQNGEIIFENIDYVEEVENDLLLETGDILYNRTNSADQVECGPVFPGEHVPTAAASLTTKKIPVAWAALSLRATPEARLL